MLQVLSFDSHYLAQVNYFIVQYSIMGMQNVLFFAAGTSKLGSSKWPYIQCPVPEVSNALCISQYYTVMPPRAICSCWPADPHANSHTSGLSGYVAGRCRTASGNLLQGMLKIIKSMQCVIIKQCRQIPGLWFLLFKSSPSQRLHVAARKEPRQNPWQLPCRSSSFSCGQNVRRIEVQVVEQRSLRRG